MIRKVYLQKIGWWICFLLVGQLITGQSKLNFGMAVRQPRSEWPQSKAPVPVWERKNYQPIAACLIPDEENNFILSNGWEMIEGYKLAEKDVSLWDLTPVSDWYNAVVPGTVLTTLVEQQVYPDPYYGLNNLLIPDTLCRMDWWYRIAFEIPEGKKDSDYRLLLNGINYKADIWLNGTRLGNMRGAFKRGFFDLQGVMKKEGLNILAVHIFPPDNPGIPYEENKEWFGPNGGTLCLDGPTFISSEGWDWIPGIRDRNIGIWQDVRLVRSGNVELVDPQVITDLPLPDTTSANICLKALLVNRLPVPQTVTVKGEIGSVSFSQSVTLAPSSRQEVFFTPERFPQLHFDRPALWWPNGYGAQPLYLLTLKVQQENRNLQTKKIRFGIRELSYELMARTPEEKNTRFLYSPTDVKPDARRLFDFKNRAVQLLPSGLKVVLPTLSSEALPYLTPDTSQPDNPFLTIRVNGRRIFCKGGNWGMDDGMKRVTRERLEPYFRLHQEAHYTMIRNWTGESTEDLFYSLCDEYGLLVWNDFSLSTEGYNLEPVDQDLFLENARDIVRRFRNHPSIAIWCPRNEGYAPALLEEGLQEIIAAEDGTRHYHGNSKELNLRPSGPWHYIENQLTYLTSIADGFSTEVGAPSVPTAETLRKFIPQEDLWPIGDVWYYHDLHYKSFDWEKYIREVNRLGKSECANEEEFCTRAQFLNYNLYRNMFETWNRKMWNYASGLLLWMSHPAWPSLIWQTYSYDYETHGSYYGVKKACEPVHIQWNALERDIRIINTTLKEISPAQVRFSVFTLQGKEVYKKTKLVDVAANAVTDCGKDSIPSFIRDLSLVRLRLIGSRGEIISQNDYWVNPSDPGNYTQWEERGMATLRIRSGRENQEQGNRFLDMEIKNISDAIARGIKINVRDSETHQALLPVYVSDGYFNLLPGERKKLRIEIPASHAGKNYYLSANGLNVSSAGTERP